MLLVFSSAVTLAQTGGSDDPVLKEEATTQIDETGPEPFKKVISTPRAFYNFLKSHYDDGLVFESSRGNFRVRYKTLLQYQFSAVDDGGTGGTDTKFFFRRIRLNFDGHAFRPWLSYSVQLSRDDVKLGEANDGSGVEFKDFYLDIVYYEKVFPRIGQFRVPFNREQLNPGSALLLVERSIVNSEFSFGRKIGGALYGILGRHVAYGGAVFTASATDDTADASSVDTETFAGRVQFNFGGTPGYTHGGFPTGGDYELIPDFTKVRVFVLGTAVAYIPGLNLRGNDNASGAIIERFMELGIEKGDVTSIATDASFKIPMYNLEAAYIGRWIAPEIGGSDTVYDQGFRLQTGLFMVPDTLELVGRWAFIDFGIPSGTAGVGDPLIDSSNELSTGINYYISQSNKWKLQLSYSLINDTFTDRASDEDQKVFRLQFQAHF
jgi:phosphate-selective porin